MYTIPHTTAPLQTQNFIHEGYDLTMTTYYNSVFGLWAFDLFDNTTQQYITQYEALSAGAPALLQSKLPFVFVMLSSILDVNIMDRGEYREAIRA